jgi:dipeptidyl aminopeptidase/acylaminoacyl peptidase
MTVKMTFALLVLALAAPLANTAAAQGTAADYERANGLKAKYEHLVANAAGPATWIGKTHRFWYRLAVTDGSTFIVYDADTRQKRPAFDHQKLAAALSAAAKTTYTALTLPFTSFTLADDEHSLEFTADGMAWRCTLTDYACKHVDEADRPGAPGQDRRADDAKPRVSPDKKWEAVIDNFNVGVRSVGTQKLTLLSLDGSEGNPYQLSSIAWSPDSRKIAAYRVRPGYRRELHYVQSSPDDQLQPKSSALRYAKPGDVLDLSQPVLFDMDTKRQTNIDPALFPNPYALSRLEWRKDSRAVTFEYNQRGHQVYRVIEVDAATGAARAVISEEPKTFFNYRTANGSQTDSGKKYRYDAADGREVIWMSERDGWNHLYLFDGVTGAVKNQITKGEWAVRGVIKVDEAARHIWFSACGMYPGKDPYFLYYYRINFDGTGLIRLTGDADANHNGSVSADQKYFVDTYSRVDTAPRSELRRVDDGSLVAEIEQGDIRALTSAGWRPPEVFTAPGRDGKTDIWGVIIRPSNFDPSRRYPVVENIYAGPQGSFVPKSFAAFNPMMAQADLGFIVVQIDGMGTSNRSKAFQDVAWKNLGDAGLPDRVLWHKAVAAKYPWYDISRAGVYGTSAGGQNSLGALLFQPDFYKAAVSAAGCHDNRMDKIWWNEQWMGWPLGPQYSASSNVDNAYRLQGHVLLVVGEMDNNVDPSSTMQVVNQLIKHNKDFDLLFIPGAGHGAGGAYGEHKRFDFFVRHLLGVNPPEWSDLDRKASTQANDDDYDEHGDFLEDPGDLS